MMAINNNQIQAMLAQIRATGAQITPPANQVKNVENPLAGETVKTKEPGKIDFAEALRATLDNVNSLQVQSEHLGQQFSLGNDDVQLSDVMISMQKASIALQTTVQARNRLVSAYQEIMGMQI
ncbi:MAG: flagellar hook-basal body complex protein FliE [Oxalobacter formigenes]|nr:flagellar hook-basal body complex protein FliE [Oxalobacter formigenes]